MTRCPTVIVLSTNDSRTNNTWDGASPHGLPLRLSYSCNALHTSATSEFGKRDPKNNSKSRKHCGVELLRTWCLEENSSWMNSLLNIRTYSLKPDTALSDNMKPDDGVPGIVSTLASSILCAVAKTAQADTARFRFAPVVHIPQSTRAAHSE